MAELISRLMSHYWTADDHPAVRQAQAEDWLEDLTEFTVETVAAACREWRQSYNRRPTPHDIREACIREAGRRHQRSELDALPAPTRTAKPRILNCWEPGYAKRYDEPWFRELPIETQRRYKEQDLARADAWRRMREAGSVEDRAAADEAYMQICMNQFSKNISGFGKGSRPQASDDLSETKSMLGISAQPSRWQSDDAIRADADALGLGVRNG